MRLINSMEWLAIALTLSFYLDQTLAATEFRINYQHYDYNSNNNNQHLQQQQQQQQQQPQQQQHQLLKASSNSISSNNNIASNSNPTSFSSSSPVMSSTSNWLGPELMIVRRIYDDCQNTNDFMACLKQKALQALSRALEQDSIKIVDGLVLEKHNHTEKESIINTLTDARALNSLPPLDRALLAKADQLVRTHALKIDMSVGRDRKKRKGGHIKYVIAALLTAMGIAGPIGLKALAAIAGKALVISKVALTIAGIIALKKLFSHDHHEETSFQVHAGDHNRRSTYVIRPVTKSSPVPAAAGAASASSTSVDPYRYYYEYH